MSINSVCVCVGGVETGSEIEENERGKRGGSGR